MKHFDGITGTLAARVMAASNSDMEEAAVNQLNPAPGDAVLEIGFGPGVGLELLSRRLTSGPVGGVDPSGAMMREAKRRNRAAIAEGRLKLVKTTADSMPWPDGTFDGAIAVNSVQLFDPLEVSVLEVARVLKPGGRFVTLTHDWAIARDEASPDIWMVRFHLALAEAGFEDVHQWTGKARTGETVGVAARKRGEE